MKSRSNDASGIGKARHPVRFGAIWRNLRVINHEYGKFKP